MIVAHEVGKRYSVDTQHIYALQQASFTIEDGEFVVILGPSGAGKSTLLNILGGIDTMDEGDILVDGESLASKNEKALCAYRAEKIGFIFQFYNLIPTLSVAENVALMKDVKRNTLPFEEVLTSVGLQAHGKKFPTQLSGGEQQRVSIARAICKNPDILLCDEPTGALDSETGKIILTLLQDMCRTYHKTTIIVTHNANIAACGDKVIRIHNGSIRSVTVNEHPLLIKDVEW